MAVVFCTALFAGSAVWADDAATLREAQAALDKADYDQAVRILKPLVDGGISTGATRALPKRP